MIGKAIEKLLLGNTQIAALVDNRLYPLSNKAEGLPSIYYVVSITPGYNNNGQQMQSWTVSILTICKTYSGAWDLALLIKQEFHHYRRREIENVKFVEVRCTNIRDDYEFNIGTYGQMLEFQITTNNLI